MPSFPRRGVDAKHVHAVSSISALTLLAGNGFGIATLPRCVAEQLGPETRVCILETSLPLEPLPLHASYWSTLTNPFLKQSIQEALAYAREYGTRQGISKAAKIPIATAGRKEQPPRTSGAAT